MDLKTQAAVEDVIEHYYSYSEGEEYITKTLDLHKKLFNQEKSPPIYITLLDILNKIYSSVAYGWRLPKKLPEEIKYLERALDLD